MLIGLLGAFALVLAASGVLKLRNPDPTVRAVLATKLPGAWRLSGRPFVRLVAVGEILVAAAVLIAGGVAAAALLAGAYLSLALVAWRLVRQSPGQDCGCFGKASEPVSWWHVAINMGGAMVALIAVIRPAPAVVRALGADGALAIPQTAGVFMAAFLLYLVMTALPSHSALRAKVLTRP
jgi:hypothetical protein